MLLSLDPSNSINPSDGLCQVRPSSDSAYPTRMLPSAGRPSRSTAAYHIRNGAPAPGATSIEHHGGVIANSQWLPRTVANQHAARGAG